jgi:hypothetical protein
MILGTIDSSGLELFALLWSAFRPLWLDSTGIHPLLLIPSAGDRLSQ